MTDRSSKNSLTLTIRDPRGSFQRVLAKGDKLTAGTSPDNDVVLFDSHFPKSFVLLCVQGDGCRLQLTAEMQGDIRSRRSVLALQDLMDQDILPQKNNFYQLIFSTERIGSLQLGDTIIEFQFAAQPKTASNLPDYSWRKAAGKDFSKELLFKFLLAGFIVFEAWFALHLQHVELPVEQPPESNQVQKRFARFMIAPKPVENIAATVAAGNSQNSENADAENGDEGEATSTQTQQQRQKRVTESGLLGLIGGTGTSSNKSATADLLISEGVIQELDNVLGNATLRQNSPSGNGRKNSNTGGGNGNGDLLGLENNSSVDDILAETGGLTSVQLERKGSVNIQQPQAMRGSQAAKGQRTQESVMQIINAQHGHIMYTYNRYLRQNPQLGGKISVDITIAADGHVASVNILESTVGNEEFVRDIINIIRRLQFGAISEGEVTVNMPFVFNRAM